MKKILDYLKKALKYFFSFLASMNLAVFVLSVLSLIIILQMLSERMVGAGKFWKWLEFIASGDFYHSKGFTVLLILFCINLLACSIKRLPATFRGLRASSKELNEGMIASLPLVERFKVKDSIESSENLSAAITTHFKKPKIIKKGSGQLNLYAEKGRYTHLGFHLAHLSILVIILGVMLSTKGYEYSFQMRKDQVLDPLVVRDNMGIKKPLDFALLCEDLETIYHKGTSKVNKHQSTLTILNDGEKVKTQVVDFGHPLRYQGFDIYQDRYSRKVKYATIKVVSKDGGSQVYEVKSGSNFRLEGTGLGVIATRFKSNTVQLRSSFSASRIWVSRTPVRFSDEKLRDYQFSLVEVSYKESTSLKVISDPGMKVIWYAAFCMLIGFGIIFFVPHRQIWLSFKEEEEGKIITIAGSATKSVDFLEETFKNIVQDLKKNLTIA